MLYTPEQIIHDQLQIPPFDGEGKRLSRWLDDIWGGEKDVDELCWWFKNVEGAAEYSILALAGNRLWLISLTRLGYNTISFPVSAILHLQLEGDGLFDKKVMLRIAVGSVQKEFAGEGDNAKRLISLHRLLSS